MLRLKRPLRPTSNADPEDTLATKLRLADLGFYEPPTGEFHGWPDAEMFAGLRMAQEAAGERVDGEMLPGGPTEAAINRLAASRPPIPKDKPNDYQRALAKGLVRPEDAIANSEAWGDSVRRQTGMQPTPTAAAAIPVAASLFEAAEAAFAAGAIGAGIYNLPRWLGGAASDEVPRTGPTADSSRRWALPPEKPEPFRGPSENEGRKFFNSFGAPPKPNGPPTVEGPLIRVQEEVKLEPEQILTLPPELVREWTISHAHTGDDDTKHGVDLAIRRFYVQVARWVSGDLKKRFEHKAGGTLHGEGVGKRLPERIVRNKATGEYSIPDVIIHDTDEGRDLYYNTGKMMKSRPGFIASERRQLERLRENAPTNAIADALKKLRAGMSEEELIQVLDEQLEQSLTKYFGRPPQTP